MNVEPNDLLLFARVVDEGSFSRAAERLGLPKSTVSRRLSALEAQLGERLLLRTTRKLTVTDFGLAVLEHARHVVEDVAAADVARAEPASRADRQAARDDAERPRHDRARAAARRVRPEIPAITLEVDLSARFVDLIGENFDVAIRMGNLRDDASLAAPNRRVRREPLRSAVVRPRRGTPSEPEALMEHDALRILSRTGDPMPWVLSRGEERWEGMPPGPRDGEFTRSADANGARGRRNHRHQRSLRLAPPATGRARPGAARLASAVGHRMGGISGSPPDAGANARLPRRARREVHRSGVPGHRCRREEDEGEIAALASRGAPVTARCRPSSPSCRTPRRSAPARAGRSSSLCARRTARGSRRRRWAGSPSPCPPARAA